MRSTTRIARSQRLEPRERRFVKDSWPGVSIIRTPGRVRLRFSVLFSFSQRVRRVLGSK